MGGIVGGLMGGGGDGGSSESSSASGYAALPPAAQQAYDKYFGLVGGLGGVQLPAFPKSQVSAPRNPFDSSELYALQQNSNGPIKPVGFQEPFNQYQRSALTAWGEPDYSVSGMQQYMNPYQQLVQDNVINQINRQSDMSRSALLDRNSRLNSRALGSSLGTQLSQNEEARNRLIADNVANLSYQGYNQALGLRDNALQQQYAAGSSIQGLNQALLDAANPKGQFSLDPRYIQASLLAPLYSAFPQSSTSQSSSEGPSSGGGGGLSQILGLGMSLFG